MMKMLGKDIANSKGKSFSVNLDFILGLLIMLILGLGTWGLTRVVSLSESVAMKASKEEVACEIRDLSKEIKNDFKELRQEIQVDIRSLIKEVTELTRKVDAIYGYNKNIE